MIPEILPVKCYNGIMCTCRILHILFALINTNKGAGGPLHRGELCHRQEEGCECGSSDGVTMPAKCRSGMEVARLWPCHHAFPHRELCPVPMSPALLGSIGCLGLVFVCLMPSVEAMLLGSAPLVPSPPFLTMRQPFPH